MEIVLTLIDFVLHVDKHLQVFVQTYGAWVYAILFAIIFIETGLVVMPFLPGDSLLFIPGAFAARGDMNIIILFIALSIAAIIGDSFNYWIGSYIGDRVFVNNRFVKKEHIDKTKEFYSKYGGKTIVLARFIPIIRTFAPFVAGIGRMEYSKFLGFNILGGLAWVGILLFGGYFFGRIQFVQDNLMKFILLIIFISIIPIIIEYVRNRKRKKTSL